MKVAQPIELKWTGYLNNADILSAADIDQFIYHDTFLAKPCI